MNEYIIQKSESFVAMFYSVCVSVDGLRVKMMKIWKRSGGG